MKNIIKKTIILLIVLFQFALVSCNTSSTKVDELNQTKKETYEDTYEETEEEIYDETEAVSNDSNDNIELPDEKKVNAVLKLSSITGYRGTDKSTYIEISFNKEIADNFDALPYIKVEPNIYFTVSKVFDKLVLSGDFNSKQTYNINVLDGVKAIDGSLTNKVYIEQIRFDQKKPKIMFTNEGIILPTVNDKKVYLRTLNVTKIKLEVRKIYANNTTAFLQSFNFNGNGTYNGSLDDPSNTDENYDNDYVSYYNNRFSYIGDVLYSLNFDIENEIDTWVQSAIDLSDVLDNKGFYMVTASFDEKGTSYNFNKDSYGDLYWSDQSYLYNNGSVQKTLLLTDIGIMAQKTQKGLHVNVLNIVDNNTIRGAKVYLVSKNNQILEEKTTNADGVAEFEFYKNSFYVVAENRDNKSILVLRNALNTNGFAVDGAYTSNGINGFIYTERGVYRPGDTIYTAIIARNNGKALEDNQPVKISVFDPTGVKIIENEVLKDGKNGFYTYSFKTDTSSKTGIWKLVATIGNNKFNKDISVETVVPNKIRVNLDIPSVVEYKNDVEDWGIRSNYLFGEPAGNLNYFVEVNVKEEPINFEKYKDYSFKVPSSYKYSQYFSSSGKLNQEGYSNFRPKLDNIDFGSLNALADVIGNVTDDGGRTVISKKYVKIKKYDTYVGIENTNTYKKSGSNLDLKAICVTEDGENLVPNKKLKYRIYTNDYYWWLDYYNYDEFVQSFKSDKNTTLYKEGEFVTTDQPYIIRDEIPESEYIYVEIEDEETSQIAGVNIQSSDWVDPSITKKIETLNIRTDKKKYSVGDVARISYKSSSSAKAIITIEKAGNIINQYYRDINSEEMIEDIVITKEMAPNVYVYITLLQNYIIKENDRPIRLYGIVPLNVEDEDTKIDLEINAPDQIRPNEKFVVNIKNKKNKQVDYTIAVVDEGLLDITGYKTPSPFDYFLQKLAANITLYDNYSTIIDKPYGAINQILKVGGGEEILDEMARRRRLKELGLEEADRFTPVSMFKGVLTTDAQGNANVEFDMPNYMGQVRIMVVAASGDSYGSVEKDMIVKAPLIVLPTLPRTMKTGDKLSIPVSVFALEDGLNNVEVYYNYKNNKQSKILNLAKGQKEIVYFDEEVGNEVSSDKLTIGVKSNIYNYEETVGMAVNSNNKLVDHSENKELKGNEQAIFTQNTQFVKGTFDSILTISNKMNLGIDKRLKYLIQYPYGCAEQTTSSVFPQLFIDKLSTNQNYDKQSVVNNINAGITRLQLFQLSDGAFSYWPGEKQVSDWATNYIGHFIVCAKKNGYYVPNNMYDKWLDYTSRKVRTLKLKSEFDINWKSYALYLLSLAGKPNISEMNHLFENYFNNGMMNLTSKMYLAAAYKLSGEETIAINIANSINTSGIKKMYDELFNRDRYYYRYSYGSKLREIAVYLDCYYTIYGRRDQEAFDEILGSLRGDYWYSTQTTAYSLLALSNITYDNVDTEIKGIIDIDGVQTEYSTKDKYRMLINEDAKTIKVMPQNEGMTFVDYYWEAIPIKDEVEEYEEGFTITRHYYDNDGKAFNPVNTKSGDTFWLEVVVKPNKRSIEYLDNIALTQVLPSGWEIDNTRLTNQSLPNWIKNDTNVSYTDIRDDRVMWFFNYDDFKEYKFYIKINSVTKGEYSFPGTTLEAMYDHDYRAYKKGSKIKVN